LTTQAEEGGGRCCTAPSPDALPLPQEEGEGGGGGPPPPWLCRERGKEREEERGGERPCFFSRWMGLGEI